MLLPTSLLAGGVSSLGLLLVQWRTKVPYVRRGARVLAAIILGGLLLILGGKSVQSASLVAFATTVSWRSILVALPLIPTLALARFLWPSTPSKAAAASESMPAPTSKTAPEHAPEHGTAADSVVANVTVNVRTKGAGVPRRTLLRATALALPTGGAVFGIGGQLGALQSPHLRSVALHAPTFPSLRIAQLSDLHLGLDKTVADVAKIAEELSREPLDLLVITGDIADRLPELAPALALLSQVPTRLGKFAVLGNHDHFHDVHFVRRKFDACSFHLLTNENVTLKGSEGTSVTVAGIDDPYAAGYRDPLFRDARFFRGVIERTLRGAPSVGPRILLSHRPEALDANVPGSIILSGHTHGGQLGMLGRSLADRVSPARFPYPWGIYERSGSTLYTTSGFGHWFPFRFGCRAETPLLSVG